MNKRRRFLLDLTAIVALAMLVPGTGRTAAQEPSSPNGVTAHMVVRVEARHGYDALLLGPALSFARCRRDRGRRVLHRFLWSPVNFVPYLDDLTHRLSHQYLLAFLAKPQKKAGLRQVKVMTEMPNAELVAADRVYVPAGS